MVQKLVVIEFNKQHFLTQVSGWRSCSCEGGAESERGHDCSPSSEELELKQFLEVFVVVVVEQ